MIGAFSVDAMVVDAFDLQQRDMLAKYLRYFGIRPSQALLQENEKKAKIKVKWRRTETEELREPQTDEEIHRTAV